MPSPFSLGVQNADTIFDGFADGQVAIGLVASATGDATVTGLGFTPDWVLAQGSAEGDTLNIGWSATSTTLTFSKSATTAMSVSYMCGNLS